MASFLSGVKRTLLVAVTAGLMLMPALPVRAETPFEGQFDGIADATGMTLSLQDLEGRIVGRFGRSSGGQPFALNGRRSGDKAQGALTRQGMSAFFHVETRPLGLQFLFIPGDAAGKPDLDAAVDYSFVRRGVTLSQATPYKPAPPRGEAVDILTFIDDYRKWSPHDMARLYGALPDAHRTLIQLYDHASAEILWRICLTNPPNAAVSPILLEEMLDRQNTDCAAYVGRVEEARVSGLFGEFLRKVKFQFELIRETVRCDRGQSPDHKCADVNALAGPLILRWQEAQAIMGALAAGRSVVKKPTPKAKPQPVAADLRPASRPVLRPGQEEAEEARVPVPRAKPLGVGQVVAFDGPLPRRNPRR